MPVAVVTGANRGLGFEMVRQLLQRDFTVHATYRTSPGLLSTLGDERLHLHQVDVRDGQAIAGMMDTIGGSIDLLINNAGIADGRWPSVEAIDFDVASEVLEVNAVAPVRVTQAALPHLADGGGTVVMITSLMGSIADCMSGRSYAYRASKTALNMFTVAMKNELRERGVSVVLIHPGWVETDMGGPNAPIQAEESVNGIMARIEEQTLALTGRFVDYTGQALPW
ncbi:MAG: SDR family oxidoreductase [Candidatus Thermoplasmatota archaeon]|nr:SDR family oxidoreductase [Candidatus Thermoplasmatota archaeon]MEC8681961.1 SDR family oxidoreductase [Candidatus Thermoplasmatota archaeon]